MPLKTNKNYTYMHAKLKSQTHIVHNSHYLHILWKYNDGDLHRIYPSYKFKYFSKQHEITLKINVILICHLEFIQHLHLTTLYMYM